ncbi:MAG: DUF2480 family protein [Bacteroidota bacterium]|nr:DUF2480 family protein [Bacteroidota bacterium]
MEGEIVNRVANSSLQIFDLEDFYPKDNIVGIDISVWLFEGVILKEKEFRSALLAHDWTQYQKANVYLYCSTDAIIPAWTYTLVATFLSPYALNIRIGTKNELIEALYVRILNELDYSVYQDKLVLIKGCAKYDIPQNAYVLACQKMIKHAKSVMYGEACSTVPLYKRK